LLIAVFLQMLAHRLVICVLALVSATLVAAATVNDNSTESASASNDVTDATADTPTRISLVGAGATSVERVAADALRGQYYM
jgi:ABC-type phosphate transport system substrate-binding protein